MSLYKKYYTIVEQIKSLTSERDRIKKEVLKDLKEKGQIHSTEDGIKATLSIRQKVKYDEEGIICYLENLGYDSKDFCKEQVHLDMEKIEKILIRPGRVDAKEIAKYTEVKTTEVLLIKESDYDSE